MHRFIGTKTILARALTRGEYNAYRGWNPPDGEDQSAQGYLVEYTDGGTPNDPRHVGYISWSPKEQFDNAYRRTDAMTFGLAVEALKRGHRLARTGWNGKGMFVFLVPGSQFNVNRPPLLGIYPEGTPITYRPHIDIKGADGSISTWVPSIGDVMAEDWQIVDDVLKQRLHVAPKLEAAAVPVHNLSRQLAGANLPLQQRLVIEEKRDLDMRKEELEAFFETPTFAQLDDVEQGRLHAQRNAMAAYSRILGERINAFAGGADADFGASTPG